MPFVKHPLCFACGGDGELIEWLPDEDNGRTVPVSYPCPNCNTYGELGYPGAETGSEDVIQSPGNSSDSESSYYRIALRMAYRDRR